MPMAVDHRNVSDRHQAASETPNPALVAPTAHYHLLANKLPHRVQRVVQGVAREHGCVLTPREVHAAHACLAPRPCKVRAFFSLTTSVLFHVVGLAARKLLAAALTQPPIGSARTASERFRLYPEAHTLKSGLLSGVVFLSSTSWPRASLTM